MDRFLKWAGYLLLLIALLLLIGLLKWESLSYFVIQKAAKHFAGRSNIAVDIGSISGKPFSETTIKNISIRPEEGQPQKIHLTANSITCSYNLWDLRESTDFFLQGLNCSVNDPDLSYDLRLETTRETKEKEKTQFSLPAVLPALEVHNGHLTVIESGWEIDLREFNVTLRSPAAAHLLQLQAGAFRFTQAGETRIETGFTSSLHYAAEKLTIDTFVIGDRQISAAGYINLEQVHKEIIGFSSDLEFADSSLNIAGSIGKDLLQAYVRTEQFEIGELQRRLGGTGWDVSGNIRAEADLAVDWEKLEGLDGSFIFDVDNGRYRGQDIESVSVKGFIGDEKLNVSSAEAITQGNHILISDVSVPLMLLKDIEVLSIMGGTRAKFKVDITESASLIKLFKIKEDVLSDLVRPVSLSFSGSLESGYLHVDNARAAATDSSLVVGRTAIPIPATPEAFESVPIDFSARFESSNLHELAGLLGDLPFSGQAAVDISVSGTLKEPLAAINLTGEKLHINEVVLGALAVQGDLRLIQETLGALESAEFTVNELTQTSTDGTLVLASPSTVTWQQDALSMSAALQVDDRGEVTILLAGNPEKEISGEITTSNLDSDGWLKSFIDERYFFKGVDLKALFSGLSTSPHVQLAGAVKEAGAADVDFPLTGSFSIQYSPRGIEVSEFTWKSYERNKLTITGFLPYDPLAKEPFLDGDLSLAGYGDIPSLEDIAVFLEPWGIGKGSIDLNIDLTGSWDQPQGHILLKAKGLQPPDTLRQYIDSSMNITCDIVAEDDSVFLKTANLDSTLYKVQASGSWQHGFSLKELMEGRQAELRGQVSADADVQLKDLNFLRHKISGLRRFDGDMQGRVHVSGSINDPTVTGSFSLRNGEVSHTFSLPMLSAINLQGELDGRSIIIKNMQLEVGGSPVELSGSINREKETAEVSMNMTGQNVLLFRNNDIRMRGDVDFAVTGPPERLAVQGTIGLTDGQYTRNIDLISKIGSAAPPASEGGGFLFSFSDPPLKDAVFDIRITSIEPFRIRTNLVRGFLRPELSLRGTGELPFLVGRVYIDPSRVLLPSGRLTIQSGVLHFLAANPDRPELDLIAQSRVLGYEINVITRGPLDDLAITLSSSPALPNDDLMLLLLTGQPPRDDMAAGTQSTASTNVMLYLGRDFLTRWLDDESGASDETILDRFDMSYGRDVTKSGDQTLETSFRLSKDITGTGRKYYLTGEKDKYDAYNYGLRLVFRLE